MSFAQKCPVCGGSGKLPTDTTAGEKVCHGCNGKGWVAVPSDPMPPLADRPPSHLPPDLKKWRK